MATVLEGSLETYNVLLVGRIGFRQLLKDKNLFLSGTIPVCNGSGIAIFQENL